LCALRGSRTITWIG